MAPQQPAIKDAKSTTSPGTGKANKLTLLNERYAVDKVLGKGSFGTVMRGLDTEMGKPVAIKLFKSDEEDETFEQEFAILDAIRRARDSPSDADGREKERRQSKMEHLLRMTDHFHLDGKPYIVLEYVSSNLYDVMTRRKLSPEEVINVGYSLLSALDAMSNVVPGMTIVHGDIKPENIMLSRHGRLKLVDYGLSFFENKNKFDFCQSPYYRAPEVYLAKRFTQAIDVWSIACVMIMCHTGDDMFECTKPSHHLKLMAEYFGMIPASMLEGCEDAGDFYEKNPVSGQWRFKETKDPYFGPNTRSLITLLGAGHHTDYGQKLYKLLVKMFRYEPKKRLSAAEGLNDAFFIQCRDTTPLIFADE